MAFQNYSFPKLCGLLGQNPTKLSQAMHNAAFKALKLNYQYVAFDTLETELALQAMRDMGIRGYSLTIPHKEKAISFVDQLSDEAKQIAATNTVINDEGKLTAYNTDCYGISEAFREKNISLKGKRVFLFGAGGASRAAVYSMQQDGAGEILITNRNDSRAESLAKEFSLTYVTYSDVTKFPFKEVDIFINCTPIGSHLTSDSYPFDLSVFSSKHVVFDMVSDDTELLKQVERQDSVTISGLRMLLFQAAKQSEYFTGQKIPVQIMEGALYTFYSTL